MRIEDFKRVDEIDFRELTFASSESGNADQIFAPNFNFSHPFENSCRFPILQAGKQSELTL